MIKRLYAYITGKSIKQRIYIAIALTLMLTMTFFIIKGNFFDAPKAAVSAQTESAEHTVTSTADEDSEETDVPPAADTSPQFHISLIDVGILLAVIGAYCVHKFKEKKKQRRL